MDLGTLNRGAGFSRHRHRGTSNGALAAALLLIAALAACSSSRETPIDANVPPALDGSLALDGATQDAAIIPCPTACGTCQQCVGGACVTATDGTYCGGNAMCQAGVCCAGCWDGTSCVEGASSSACGAGGEKCAACAGGSACVANICVTPTQIAELGGGNAFTCAVRGDHSLWCWGSNICGELGQGPQDNVPHSTPTQVTGSWARVASSSGALHTCAIKTDHTLWCWGCNDNGELGQGTQSPTGNGTPTQVGADTDWAQVTTGQNHSCAMKTDSSVWCWGSNGVGQAGVAGFMNPLTPAKVVSSGAVQISAGITATCMVVSDGSLSCWGYGFSAGVGGVWLPETTTPTAPFASYDQWSSVSMGGGHMCGRRQVGQIWCWGDDTYGEIGADGLTPSSTPLTRPIQVSSFNDWTHIVAGSDFTMGRRGNGTIYAWGRGGSSYRLGQGEALGVAPMNRITPTQIGVDSNWSSAIAYTGHACATKNDQSLWCWGDNGSGQVGSTNTTEMPPISLPFLVSFP